MALVYTFALFGYVGSTHKALKQCSRLMRDYSDFTGEGGYQLTDLADSLAASRAFRYRQTRFFPVRLA